MKKSIQHEIPLNLPQTNDKECARKKKYYIEINEHSNKEIHLHVKRNIFSIHFFVKSYLTLNFFTFLMINQNMLPKIAKLFKKKNT